MTSKIRGIVLQTVRHNDRHNIVTVLTESHGRVSFLSPVSTGRSSSSRSARLTLLSEIETEVRYNRNRDLQFLGAVSTPRPRRTLYFDPVKLSMTLFISDLLMHVLRSVEPDSLLYRYVEYAVERLDTMGRGVANFHICFMMGLLPLLGIEPDYHSYEEDFFFDMREGVFVGCQPAHNDFIRQQYGAYMLTLSRINFRNLSHFQMSASDRNTILDILMRYYAIHLPVSPSIKSLSILRELFK